MKLEGGCYCGNVRYAAEGNSQMAIFTVDKQPFHAIPEGIPSLERLPKR
jgi:hypothetical protein